MIYNDFCDLKLSALGMGCMRLPLKDKKIDVDQVRQMVKYAFDNGVNYFDTAWGYHDGESEKVMGEVLADYPRDSFYLASKFPGYDVSNIGKQEEIFATQLKKCRVDHFDFYLIHNVCETNIEGYLDEGYGVVEYFVEQKKLGKIKHLGCSVHAQIGPMKRFFEKWGRYMEFCQIQLNYVDYDFQDAKLKLDLLKQYGIPVWVMEPLRGGKLTDLPAPLADKVDAIRDDENRIGMAFRYLQSFPQVKVVLSGMSSLEQIKQNIATFSTFKPATPQENQILYETAKALTGKNTLPCTGCAYCTSYCPQKLNIPELVKYYNDYLVTDGGFLAPMAVGAMPDDKKPSACVACRSCEAVCPQRIKISEAFADFSEKLGLKK